MSDIETIAKAAVRYDGKIYSGYGRHENIVAEEVWKDIGRISWGFESGFLTNKGRFVNRAEAAKLAFASGQIKEQWPLLYSEDLY